MKQRLMACIGIVLLTGATAAAGETGETETAVFAGGCFWCMQPPYDELEGVVDTEVGYTGGTVENPGYDQVTGGGTGHLEAMRVEYDPDAVSYEQLLNVFWKNVDPLDDEGQFCDRGYHYTTAIFVKNDAQREAAERSKQALIESGRFQEDIVTPIRDAKPFYLAEEYHQDYYQKRPVRYRFYRASCGRDGRLDELWGDSR